MASGPQMTSRLPGPLRGFERAGLPTIDGYEIEAHSLPSRSVSGDYYEIVTRDEGRECVVMITDVSGKGIAASLLTASVEALATGPIEENQAP